MSVIDVNTDIDTVTMSQMPLIGRAIAKERGREFLDKGKNNLYTLIPMPCGMAPLRSPNILMPSIYSITG